MGFAGASWAGKVSFICLGFLLSIVRDGLFLWLGIRQFRKMEKRFADLM